MPTMNARQMANLNRLRAYDDMAVDSERASLAERRIELQEGKVAQDAAFKEARLAAQAESLAQRAATAEAAVSQRDTQLRINQELSELRQLQEARKADRALEVIQQAKGFLSDARGMRPTAPDFDTQLENMRAGYPDAIEHPAVKEWFEYNTTQRKAWLEEQQQRGRIAELTDLGMQPQSATIGGVTLRQPADPKLGTEREEYDPMTGDLVSRTVTRPIRRDGAPAQAARQTPAQTPAPMPRRLYDKVEKKVALVGPNGEFLGYEK